MSARESVAIAVEGVDYAYDRGVRALDGVALDVAAASIVALLGPNGSGKSTLLKLVAQLDRPHVGTIAVLGESSAQTIRARIGVVFQAPSLDGRLTVRENLAAHAALLGLSADAGRRRMGELMESMGLFDRAEVRVGRLSLGLVRRVDLARALLHEPDLLLLDEPTVGLDPPSRAAFLDAVRADRDRRGATVLMSTHLIDEAELADRVVLMHRGRIVADGAPGTLRAALGPRVLVVADDPRTLGDVAGATVIDDLPWTRRANGWVAAVADDAACAKAIAAFVAAGRSFSFGTPTLADLFAKLTGEALGDAAATTDTRDGGRRRHGRDRQSRSEIQA